MKRRKNSRLMVGRAGHDPATYGLKGPLSKLLARLVLRVLTPSVVARSPRVNQRQVVGIPQVTT